ncbi:GNAT family N-acetyltransferase [Actinacidiphila alni]|uniref:GNAT family N-acetyltransferase n=1 Tax=Actinacidiphila alni TaxID=380248 RepID=UPI0033FDEAC4
MSSENPGPAAEKPVPSVRRRVEGDIETCVRVLDEVHRRDGYPVNWPDRPADWLSPPAPLGAWVAELAGRVVGHVGLSRAGDGDVAPGLWSERNGASSTQTAVVGRLFVAPQARGYGIGALLIGRATDEAQHHGLHPVLDVVASDAAAAALYERLGWKLMATVDQHWSPSQRVTVRCYTAPA